MSVDSIQSRGEGCDTTDYNKPAPTGKNSTMSNKTTKKNNALVPAGGNGTAIYQMDSETVDLEGFKSLRIPIIKPREMPTGAFVIGELLSVEEFNGKTFKSQLLKLVDGQEREFLFPLTATIKRNLKPTAEDYVGKTLLIKKTGEHKGEKGKKTTHLFDVAVRE